MVHSRRTYTFPFLQIPLITLTLIRSSEFHVSSLASSKDGDTSTVDQSCSAGIDRGSDDGTSSCRSPQESSTSKSKSKSTSTLFHHEHSKVPSKLPPDFQDPCQNSRPECLLWAREGECRNNANFMLNACAKACGSCVPMNGTGNGLGKDELGADVFVDYGDEEPDMTGSSCQDLHEDCLGWALLGECEVNPAYMKKNCKYSCWKCVDVRKDKELGVSTKDIAKKIIYFNLDLGQNQLVRGIDEITPSQHENVITTLRAMDEYAKYTLTNVTHVKEKDRERCRNEFRMCAEWASRGMCSPFSNDGDDSYIATRDDVVFMMNMCPLACQMCHEIQSFHQCTGRRHPWAKPLFQNGEMDSFFKKRKLLASNSLGDNTRDKISVSNGEADEINAVWKKYDPVFASYPDPVRKGGEDDPYVVILHNLVSNREADQLASMGSKIGWKAMDHSKSEIGLFQTATCRNSTFCDSDETYENIMSRISSLVNASKTYMEPMELLRFQEGEYSSPHHNFELNELWTPAGPRVLSLFVFLSDAKTDGTGGGSLGFPNLDWLYVKPRKGMAVLWPNVHGENLYDVDMRMDVEHFQVEKNEQIIGGYVHFRLFDWADADSRGCA